MNANVNGIITGTAGLWLAAAAAALLTLMRTPQLRSLALRQRTINLFLGGVAVQCLHFTEEFTTRFQQRFPALLGLPGWSDNFFVAFNLVWITVWVLAAAGIGKNYRIALFPAWFFALAAVGNGIAHPLLAVAAGGYFPGLYTSPLLGVVGVLLCLRLMQFTKTGAVE